VDKNQDHAQLRFVRVLSGKRTEFLLQNTKEHTGWSQQMLGQNLASPLLPFDKRSAHRQRPSQPTPRLQVQRSRPGVGIEPPDRLAILPLSIQAQTFLPKIPSSIRQTPIVLPGGGILAPNPVLDLPPALQVSLVGRRRPRKSGSPEVGKVTPTLSVDPPMPKIIGVSGPDMPIVRVSHDVLQRDQFIEKPGGEKVQ